MAETEHQQRKLIDRLKLNEERLKSLLELSQLKGLTE